MCLKQPVRYDHGSSRTKENIWAIDLQIHSDAPTDPLR